MTEHRSLDHPQECLVARVHVLPDVASRRFWCDGVGEEGPQGDGESEQAV
jgi:hypothetical protein